MSRVPGHRYLQQFIQLDLLKGFGEWLYIRIRTLSQCGIAFDTHIHRHFQHITHSRIRHRNFSHLPHIVQHCRYRVHPVATQYYKYLLWSHQAFEVWVELLWNLWRFQVLLLWIIRLSTCITLSRRYSRAALRIFFPCDHFASSSSFHLGTFIPSYPSKNLLSRLFFIQGWNGYSGHRLRRQRRCFSNV